MDKDYLLAVLKKFKRIERDLESRISRSLIGGHQPKPFIGFEEYLSNRKGRALISYLSAPFHISKDSSEMYSHQNYCRALEIAKVFNALEYTVDVVDLYDHTFKPRYRYDILCGNGTNFKRLAKILDKEVLKIFFTPDPHPDFRRAAEKERRNDIIKRRGIELTLRYPSVIEFPEKYIDAVICTGNSWVASNYLSFNDNVYAIGDGGFDFLQSTLVGKDFNSARKRFIWMASWLLVAKGLDLVLEVFNALPELDLYVCGPLWNEPDVIDAYEKELFHTKNIHFIGQMDLTSTEFKELTHKCAYTIFPTSGDTAAGSVWAPMRCGVMPIVSVENGMDTGDFGTTLSDCKLETISAVVIEAANRDPQECKDMAERTLKIANSYFTLEAWSHRFEDALKEILEKFE